MSNPNSWFVVEGLNLKNSSGSVVGVYTGSTNSIFRRIVAWDAFDLSGGDKVWELSLHLRPDSKRMLRRRLKSR
jgi:hypothetical protein